MEREERERSSELEATPLDPAATADLEAAEPARFTSHGPLPAVQDEVPGAAPPTASERAYGSATRAAPPPAARGVDPTILTTTVRRVIDGVTVVAPPGSHADAIDKCAVFIHQELGRNQFAQLKMAEARATIVIIPARTKMTDLPQFASLKGRTTFDGRDWSGVRGSGGMNAPDGSFAIGVAEENLRAVAGVISTYPTGYSIGMHELAHALESKALTAAQKERLNGLYSQHQKADPGDARDTFTDKYAASNVHEYFAQSTNAFFGKNEGKNKDRTPYHNGRAWLQAHDPNMYAFLVELYETNHDAEGKRVP
ncbi:MAG: hypothetical protein HOV81_12690 [Kofleriaceae bacterium]|nr:hypothetical protein [Kofleriaceae bacterium]